MVEQERTDGAVVQAHGEFSGGAILATTDSARQIQEPVDGAASIRSTSLQAPGRSACVQRVVRLAALLSERRHVANELGQSEVKAEKLP